MIPPATHLSNSQLRKCLILGFIVTYILALEAVRRVDTGRYHGGDDDFGGGGGGGAVGPGAAGQAAEDIDTVVIHGLDEFPEE